MLSDAENLEDESPLLPDNLVENGINETDDRWNIALLLFLYLLQGIPLGLSAAIPIILTNRKIDYKDQLGFSAIDAVSPLKLVENGVPKDRLALLAIPLVPMQIILPFLISKYMVGPRPMDCYLSVIPLR
ncbi:hypothetical protein V9T40_007891 [Parthenolecanium corni]|uniref:Uncharacterized protein n=1 Tax=Parthenolecanium corni TaxID=536013 RepID=A0AAN9Y4K6_9HEMI